MRIVFRTHIINDMNSKRLARILVVTGTLGGVAYVVEKVVQLTKLVF